MWIFLIGCGVVELGGLLALLFSKKDESAKWIATLFVWAGCAVAAFPVVSTFLGYGPDTLQLAWTLPVGEFHLAMDPLSAFFMLPVLILGPLTGTYGIGYLHQRAGSGAHYFFFNTLIAVMMVLLTAQNAILFLIVWEIMAVSSFFLVTFDDHLPSVRNAGWTYMIATHIGVMALLAFFAILGRQAGTFEFSKLAASAHFSPEMAIVLFGLAVVGFGSKAGIFPLHIWLPDAHPAAPSHVSALMSGVMIKMGIYGLLRSLPFLGAPTATFGWILLSLGVMAGVVGIVSALSQHNIKRMLAYSSVENIGIICIGIGIGILGSCHQQPAVAALGIAGALFHVLNHSMFKGLLFLSAGTVVHETGTKEMNHLGGLMKKMPFTATLFFVGAAAASALPPFNGFVSEFLIYFAGTQTALTKEVSAILPAAVVLTSLALIGGLAAAAFTKCAGLVFLGEPRKLLERTAKEPGWLMRLPSLVLTLAVLGLGLGAPYMMGVVASAAAVVVPQSDLMAALLKNNVVPSLQGISLVAALFIGGVILVALLYRAAIRRKNCVVERGPVWDCGYARPAASMQYTPSSFSAPIVEMFRPLVRIRTILKRPNGYFPTEGSFETDVLDHTREAFFTPLFRLVARAMLPFRILQHGHVHIYVVYVAVTLVALLLITAGN